MRVGYPEQYIPMVYKVWTRRRVDLSIGCLEQDRIGVEGVQYC